MTRIMRVLLVCIFIFTGYNYAISKTVIVYDDDEDPLYYYDDGINNLYINPFFGAAVNIEDSDPRPSLGLNILYTTTPISALGLSLGVHDPAQFDDYTSYSYGYEDDETYETDIVILEAGLIGRLYLVKIPGSIINPFIQGGVSLNLYNVFVFSSEDGDTEEKGWAGNIGLEAGAGYLLLEHLEFSVIYRTSSAANFVSFYFAFMF